MMIIATKKELAGYLPITERRMHVLFQNGVLPSKKGQKGYDLKKIFEALYNYASKHDTGKSRTPESFQTEKTRLTAAQANKAELELKVMQKELLPVQEVQNALESMILFFKGKMLAIPSKVAPQIIAQDDIGVIEDAIRLAVNDALHELVRESNVWKCD